MPPGQLIAANDYPEVGPDATAQIYPQNRHVTPATSPAPTYKSSMFSSHQSAETDLTVPDRHLDPSPDNETKSCSSPNSPAPTAIRATVQSRLLADSASLTPGRVPTDDVVVEPSNETSTVPEAQSHVNQAGDGQPTVADETNHWMVLQRLSNVAHLTDELLADQTALEQERQKAVAAEEFHGQSQHELMLAIQGMLESRAYDERGPYLIELCQHVQSDLEVYKMQLDEVKSLEAKMRNKEYALCNINQDVVSLIRKSFPNIPQPHPATPEGVIRFDTIPFGSPPSPPTPPTLLAYWEALGDVDALRDDLFDLDQEHQYEAAELERSMEREQEPPRAVSECERAFEHRRDELIEQIAKDEARASELRNDCLAHGINPDISRKVPSPSSSPAAQAAEDISIPDLPTLVNPAQSEPAFFKPSLHFHQTLPPNTSLSSDNLLQASYAERVES